ncbi:MAG TPA: hypothetical protein VFS67_13125 [Polyangiaceae bacterium]|nr:hypothetical protein [Polyangiaceae bacterium]
MLVHLEIMISWNTTHRSVLLAGAAACVLACGTSSEKKNTLFQPLETPGEVKDVPPPTPVEIPPPTPVEVPANTDTDPSAEQMADPGTMEQTGASTGCKPPPGVSGSPTTIPEALVLLNSLPKPTSLACFLQSLDRPLTLYMTESDQSLQPSPGPRSPRTFVLRGDLEMSIVFEGAASDTLEFGFRPEISRSIKTEIAFPVTKDVTEATIFDRVRQSDRTTICGACHVDEQHIDFPGFPSGVFESDVFEPYEVYEVALDVLKNENTICNEAMEPYRCELLSALFDHGETLQGKLRGARE